VKNAHEIQRGVGDFIARVQALDDVVDRTIARAQAQKQAIEQAQKQAIEQPQQQPLQQQLPVINLIEELQTQRAQKLNNRSDNASYALSEKNRHYYATLAQKADTAELPVNYREALLHANEVFQSAKNTPMGRESVTRELNIFTMEAEQLRKKDAHLNNHEEWNNVPSFFVKSGSLDWQVERGGVIGGIIHNHYDPTSRNNIVIPKLSQKATTPIENYMAKQEKQDKLAFINLAEIGTTGGLLLCLGLLVISLLYSFYVSFQPRKTVTLVLCLFVLANLFTSISLFCAFLLLYF